jgi:hypothetical protein
MTSGEFMSIRNRGCVGVCGKADVEPAMVADNRWREAAGETSSRSIRTNYCDIVRRLSRRKISTAWRSIPDLDLHALADPTRGPRRLRYSMEGLHTMSVSCYPAATLSGRHRCGSLLCQSLCLTAPRDRFIM